MAADRCMYVPAVVVVVGVITPLTVMGIGGRGGMAVVALEDAEVELETSGLVRQKMLDTKACML
jgi:hypothetical protein